MLILSADSLIGSALIDYLMRIPEYNLYGTSKNLGSKYFYLDFTSDETT